MIHRGLGMLVVAAGMALLTPSGAQAQLALTAAGLSDGFTLSTFFTQTTGSLNDYNDLVNVRLPDGNLLGVNWTTGTLYKFSNTDGQNDTSALLSNTTSFSANTAVNATVAGGTTYLAAHNGGYFTVDSNLTVTPVLGSVGLTHTWGLWTNPATQHLVASTSVGLSDIDPITGTVKTIANCGACYDGVTVSPDGKTVYAEIGGQIVSYNVSDLNNVTAGATYNFGHNPDGTAVITGGTYDGFLVVSNNDGTVGLLNPSDSSYATIASGGTRGDFVSPFGDGTLSVAEYGRTYRLGLDSGTIGSTETPEPASLTLLGAALAGLSVVRRRR